MDIKIATNDIVISVLEIILCLCYIYGNYSENKDIIEIKYSVEMKSDIVRLLDM